MAFGKVYANCNIVDVENGCKVLENSDIFVVDGKIADIRPHGVATYGWKVEDMKGAYAAPGLINLHAHLFGIVHNLLGVLRTDHKALPAQNALVADDVRLVARKPDGFDRAVPDTFVAVFAVGFFEGETVGHAYPS